MAAKSVKKEAPAAVKAPETKAVEVEATAEKAAESVKATAEKAVETVAKKAAPAKRAVKKAAAPVKEKAEKAAEKAVKAVKAPKTTVYVEYQGRQADVDKLVAAVKAQVGAVKDLQLYVKPEDSAVYYVANGDAVHGKINF